MTYENTGLTVTCANDLLNTLPAMFGFVPEESIIGVTVSGADSRCGFRLRHDLPAHGDEADLAQALAHHLVRNGGEGYLVAAVSADGNRARRMAQALRDALPAESCELVLWADDHLAWLDGGPAGPVKYAITSEHEARVQAVLGGQVILGSRAELANEISRRRDDPAEQLDRLCEDILTERGNRALSHSPIELYDDDLRRAFGLIGRVESNESLTDGELIELAILVTDIPVRDELWIHIDAANARRSHQVWAAASRLVRPDLSLAALCLAGFAAWQAGDGARALVAVDRARELDPNYSMAKVLLEVLLLGIHPDAWSPSSLIA